MSPTSAVYQFFASWSSTTPPYETMLAPYSAKVRATSSSRRGRSHASTAIWTRKLFDALDGDPEALARDRLPRLRRLRYGRLLGDIRRIQALQHLVEELSKRQFT